MALSSQALSSSTFKRSYQKSACTNSNQKCFVPSKRIHLSKTNSLSAQRDQQQQQRAYYSSSDDDDSSGYFSSDQDNSVANQADIRNRRFSLPHRRRGSTCFISKPVRRNSKCIAESNNRRIESNNSHITKIINAATCESGIHHSNVNNDNINNYASSSSMPISDVNARLRCFDYLVGAIDEAWARYCDATSFAEDKLYGNMNVSNDFPTTPVSATSSDYDSDYKTDGTELTDYDSEFECNHKKASQQPETVKIQNLKDRLIKAKNYLQEFVESGNIEDCMAFWSRWDLVKYATIELVEDDDDDEIIEDTIEELEKGRCF